jgi:uracil-DNA glycosylase
MNVKIEPSWHEVLKDEFDKPYFQKLTDFVKLEYANKTCFPPGGDIFSAFKATPFDKVRVVIIGQDPYHGEGQAHGLSFSVRYGVRIPPSLRNIFKEIKQDLNVDSPLHGDLTRWAIQGVLMLNAVLTVREGEPSSHAGKGWERFTDTVIQKLDDQKSDLVFMLWGAYAAQKGQFIDRNKHMVLEAAHPSPFSADRGFFGCGHFGLCNEYLSDKGESPIEW